MPTTNKLAQVVNFIVNVREGCVALIVYLTACGHLTELFQKPTNVSLKMKTLAFSKALRYQWVMTMNINNSLSHTHGLLIDQILKKSADSQVILDGDEC